MDKKIKLLERIVFEYLERRKKHFKDRWLNWRSLWDRFISPSLRQSKPYIKTRIDDFEFTYLFIKWLGNYIKEKNISSEDLKEFLIILENHNKKISYRFQFLLIFPTFLLIINTLFKLIKMPISSYIMIHCCCINFKTRKVVYFQQVEVVWA